MTIKHINKNISAEKTPVVTDITESPNGLVIRKSNLHDGTSLTNIINLTDAKLNLMILSNENDLELLADCDTQNELNSLNTRFNAEYQISFNSLQELSEYIQSRIFLIEDLSGLNDNIYNEYIWVNGNFELIGTTEINLDAYVRKTDVTTHTLTVEYQNGNTETISFLSPQSQQSP